MDMFMSDGKQDKERIGYLVGNTRSGNAKLLVFSLYCFQTVSSKVISLASNNQESVVTNAVIRNEIFTKDRRSYDI